MIRKSSFVFATLLLFSSRLYADTQQKVNIEQATVFLNGAELLSTAKVALPQGESEIIFTNIAGDVNQQSLSIGTSNNVVVESSTFQNNYLNTDNLSPRAKAIKDSIELINLDRSITDNQLTVTKEQLAVIQENRKISGQNTGLSVTELDKMLTLINAKMGKLLDEKQRTEKKLAKIDEHIANLNRQLDEEQKKDFQPGGQLRIKFYAPAATNTDIRLTYVVPHAGWTPTYDLRVDKINAPVNLFYKANVYQNSGVKWNNVKLVLSTGNPSEGAQAPVLNPWYLAFNTPTYATGYANMSQAPIMQKEEADRMMVTESKSVAAPEAQITLNDYVQVDNSGISTAFDIDLPYTIPSDGQEHLVAIKSYELPATYRYFAVPKKDRDAFLQAQVTNWEDLDLLPAKTNIFYEGSYVGQGYTDVRNIKDTMTFSLGRDKKIVVRREVDKTLRSVKTIGTNVRETFAYTISVRNTRKEPINITVLDQMPVSNDKDIEIEDRQYKDATLDETTGEVKWTMTVKPNETQKRQVGYTIKYPKGKVIAMR
ncbi:MAG: DUF4139 domain-containing protein [Bacteroidetes bacterium]|nr:DUF4139 domain-containing protein [Bacteroidota bacterium]